MRVRWTAARIVVYSKNKIPIPLRKRIVKHDSVLCRGADLRIARMIDVRAQLSANAVTAVYTVLCRGIRNTCGAHFWNICRCIMRVLERWPFFSPFSFPLSPLSALSLRKPISRSQRGPDYHRCVHKKVSSRNKGETWFTCWLWYITTFASLVCFESRDK